MTVFCKNCNYYDGCCGYADECMYDEKTKFNYLGDKIKERVSCSERNKNNDCSYWEPSGKIAKIRHIIDLL